MQKLLNDARARAADIAAAVRESGASGEIDPLWKVQAALHQRGWRPEDLIAEAADGPQRIDLVLSRNLYPLALVRLGVAGGATPAEALAALLERWPDIGLAYLVDGEQVWRAAQGGAGASEIDALPAPADVLADLGLAAAPGDIRLAPAAAIKRPPSLPQLIAIKRIVDSIAGGADHGLVVLPTGSGKTFIASYVIAKLLRSERSGPVLYVTERRTTFPTLAQALRDLGIGSGELGADNSQVQLASLSDLRQSRRAAGRARADQAPALAILDLVSPEPGQAEAVRALKPQYLLGIAQFVREGEGAEEPLYAASFRESFAEAEREPPAGYEGARLLDIASIDSGLIRSMSRRGAVAGQPGLYVITGNDLQPDGSIDVAGLGVVPEAEVLQDLGLAALPADALLRPADILASTWVSAEGAIKVARVPEGLPGATVSTNRLIRLRAADPERAADIYDFLRSPVGQHQLSRSRDATRISLADLSQITVFLPSAARPVAASDQPAPAALGVVAELIRQIQGGILPALQSIQARASVAGIESEYIPIGEQLQQLAGQLLPRKLEDIVVADYPTPIALAYRHFRESRFNTYEQVLRLRDVFEAVAFFIYHVVLADTAHNLIKLGETYHVSNKGAREAFDDFSTAQRMTFVRIILERARANGGQDLFMPELLQGRIVDCISKLQSDFRNVLSHTATPNARQIQRIIGEYWPIAEELLESTRFLSDYRMLRIPSFHYKQRVRRATVELYRGPAAALGEEELDINIDQDHLILVNSEQEFLDLYPLYQRIETTFTLEGSDKKRDETHLAVFKYRKKQDGKPVLRYESITGGFELTDTSALSDFDDLIRPLKPAAAGANP